MRKILLLLGLLLILCAFNWAVWQREPLLRDGTVMYLRLAPVDPRAFLLGDYMDLSFAIDLDITDALYDEARKNNKATSRFELQRELPREGHVVVTLSPQRVAEFLRLEDGSSLSSNEHKLHFRLKSGRAYVTAQSFFFQEGHAQDYEEAIYGEIHVDPEGKNLLTHLLDDNLQRIDPGAPKDEVQ